MVDLAAGLLTILAVLAAGVGYGQALARSVGARGAHWPLAITGGAGLALLAALAGWPVAAGLFSRGVGLLLLALGIALFALGRGDLPRPRRIPRIPASRGALVLVALATVVFLARALGAVRFPSVNPCDDWVAYHHLPKLLLETGGLEEPFGFRRLGTLGVAPLLQSYFFPIWTTAAARVSDAALGGLLVWGVARAFAALTTPTPAPVQVEALGLLGAVGSLTIPVPNTSPYLLPLGAALLLLWLSAKLTRGETSPRESLAIALCWGAVAAFLTGFRTSNIVFPGLLGLAGLTLALARHDAAALRHWLLGALAFGAALAPWSLASWRSSGTPFFPLIRGNYRFPHGLLEPLSAPQTLEFLASVLWGSGVWLPLLLAGLGGHARAWRGTVIALGVTLVATVAVMALALTASDSFSVARYAAPFVVAGVVFFAAVWLGGLDGIARLRHRSSLAVVALAGLVWLFLPVSLDEKNAFDAGRGPGHLRSSPARQIWNNANAALDTAGWALAAGMHEEVLEGASHFAAAEALLGEEARIVSAVSKPFFWAFDRHVVHTIDCPGQASPPPGMPFFQGPDALAAYWLDLGYTHLAFSPPQLDPCLYSIERWLAARRSGHFLWEQWAPYFEDFLRNEMLLAKRGAVVYESPDVIVVDLRRSRAARR